MLLMGNGVSQFLVAAAILNALAAALHVGCIIFGAAWYRFFGAGKRMAQLAASGNWVPTAITACIASVLTLWSLYALAGAGIGPRLPLIRIALCAITAVYLLRGLAVVPFVAVHGFGRSSAFWWWSSAICLLIGLVHLAGLGQVWARL
jgi:hypothetical protein